MVMIYYLFLYSFCYSIDLIELYPAYSWPSALPLVSSKKVNLISDMNF